MQDNGDKASMHNIRSRKGPSPGLMQHSLLYFYPPMHWGKAEGRKWKQGAQVKGYGYLQAANQHNRGLTRTHRHTHTVSPGILTSIGVANRCTVTGCCYSVWIIWGYTRRCPCTRKATFEGDAKNTLLSTICKMTLDFLLYSRWNIEERERRDARGYFFFIIDESNAYEINERMLFLPVGPKNKKTLGACLPSEG